MMLIEETAVPLAALPLDEFTAHLRLGTGFSDGDVQAPVLESFLRAAISAIEARTGKILIEREFTWIISRWRNAEGQPLPVAPVNVVNSVLLRDSHDEATVVDAANYRLERNLHRPVLRPCTGRLPTIATGGEAEIAFTAGMAENWVALPADLGHAVLLQAAHYYEYRHETGLGEGCMPFAVTTLIERYRNLRIFSGRGS